MNLENISILIIIIGVLSLITNVCTEVFKKICTNEKFTQIFVVTFSIVITIVSVIAFCNIKGYNIEWYYIIGSVIGGLFVSYSAMFGYDKLKELIAKFITNVKE